MKTFRRLTVLGLFAALGVGIALCVGLSADPPPQDEEAPVVARAAERVKTHSDDPDPVRPSETGPSAGAVGRGKTAPAATGPLPTESAPLLVSPHPLRGNQSSGSTFDASSLADIVKELKRQIVPERTPEEISTPPPTPDGTMPAETPSLPSKHKITRTPTGEGDEALSINIQNTDIREVLDMLSQQGGLNILASPNVEGKVSAALTDVDLDSALSAILRSTGFLAKREGRFLFVGTVADFEAMEQRSDTLGTRVYRPNYVKAADLHTLVQPLLTPNVGVVSVTAESKTGIGADEAQAGGDDFAGSEAILVRDYEAVLDEIDQLVDEIDVRPMQVHIEAMILSVKLNDVYSFGVDFEMLRDSTNVKIGWGSPVSDIAEFKIDGTGLKVGFLDSSLGAFISALETLGDTNVIATPRLMVLNKHRAEIQIGEQKGYISSTITETSTSQSVEFLELGTILRLRPFISSDGLVRLEIHPEISDGSVKVEGEFTLPNKEVTQVTTNIMARDGCTVVIGGLLKDQQQTSATQIPWFGNLPWIGPAFRSKKETLTRHEIIILITPRIVYEPGPCQEGEKAACEAHRRHATYADKMSPIGKRSLGRRYFRQAQRAWAAGNRRAALRKAELAVQFDPLNGAAIDLRSDIWQGNRFGDHTLDRVPIGPLVSEALDGQTLAPWLLDDLSGQTAPVAMPLHPLDPGQPGRHRDLERPGRYQ